MKSQLDLLRNEHLQLQSQHANLQKRYDILQAENQMQNGREFGSSFAEKLLETVHNLYGSELYSDLDIITESQTIRGHRLVIATRTDYWGELDEVSEIDFETTFDVASVILKWIYTDELEEERWGVLFLLDVLGVGHKFKLDSLTHRCENVLITQLEVDNCIRIYQEAEHLQLTRLRDACAEFIAASWNLFEPEHFAEMDAGLLLKLLKSHCKFILHATIQLKRTDVMMLYLVENSESTNEQDENGQFPLDLALNAGRFDCAKILCDHQADINRLDSRGRTFVSKAIEAGNIEACEFLVQNGANISYVNEETGETLIHDLAKSASVQHGIGEWAKRNIRLFDLNARDRKGRTPLFVAVSHSNRPIFDLILEQDLVDVNVIDADGRSILEEAFSIADMELAYELVQKGANVNHVNEKTGESLMHLAVQRGDFGAIQFLFRNHADVNIKDKKGSTPLHNFLFTLPSHGRISDEQMDILKVLLKSGADPTMVQESTGLTPIHFAVQRDKAVLNCLLQSTNEKLPLDVLDQEGRSPLWSALTSGKFESAQLLVEFGANVDEESSDQDSLLIRAISKLKRDDIVQFLLKNRANTAIKDKNGCSCLHLAVEQGMTSTVAELCKFGTDLNAVNPVNGHTPVWVALEKGDFGTAQVLIGNGCDLEAWSSGGEETLLHKAIAEPNEKVAMFLIKNGCDVNAKRNGQTPLHLAVQEKLTEIVKTLIGNLKCQTDAQDSEGRTAAHIAVMEKDQTILELLLSHPNSNAFTVNDKYGQRPLTIAMKQRNNKAAEAICAKLPHVTLQVNGNGENLLHLAIKGNDFEGVLFLLSLQTDVNIPVNDQIRSTPLHLCAEFGSELISRNLLLAGASVNTKNELGHTTLHIAAKNNNQEICRALLDNGADPNIADHEGNNSLHAAVSQGCIEATQLLLLESDVNPLAVNNLKRNAVHLCANVQGLTGAELFQTIIEVHPNFPLESGDIYGNTVFLLAFINGNEDLCRLTLKYGVCLGAANHQGETIFRINTPTKQLLFALLSTLDREPRWAEGEFCSECESKFTLTMRKHHCRHCGRLVCAKCSEQQMPIIKYNLTKSVRVCQACHDVLTMGVKELDD